MKDLDLAPRAGAPREAGRPNGGRAPEKAPPAPGVGSRIAVTVVSAYIAAQMLADIASVKIGVVAGLAVDMGTFVYPITFTLRDMAHKVLGRALTRLLILLAAAINVLMALYLYGCARTPGDPGWGLNDQFAAVLGPVPRIVFASILAEVVSQMANTEVFQWFVTRVTRRHQWARTLLSNGVAIPIDTLIFSVAAFAGALAWPVVWQIFLFNLIVKAAVSLASVPLVYAVRDPDTFE